MLEYSDRPVILLGQGARAAGVDCSPLMTLGIPVLTSWLAKDLVSNWHPMYCGSTGVYGNRLANKVLWEADCVIAIGNRLSIWNVGYSGLRKDQRLVMVDCEQPDELRPQEYYPDIKQFIEKLLAHGIFRKTWRDQCAQWKQRYPFLEAGTHDDANGYINSFRFTHALQQYLKPDSIIITDNGCCMVPAFSVLNLEPPQRIISSGGIGEMGCGLPMAIGASFARNKGEVLVLAGDGGMMMNLHELQTIVHHNLPIKIIVYANEGYLMIKHSQNALGAKRSGVDTDSGVSCPNFSDIADAFQIDNAEIKTWSAFNKVMPGFFNYTNRPALIEYRMDPEQFCGPKLQPIVSADGSVSSPEFWDVSPRIE